MQKTANTRFRAKLWMSSGASPMTLYRIICVRMHGKYQGLPPLPGSLFHRYSFYVLT
jgi:hypothetical protein